MGEVTGIQWTKKTWNPWQGCQKVSPGCDNCYMFRDKKRYGQDPETVVRSKPPTFNAPLKWNREAHEAGRVDHVFVASWADFFSREADDWRADAWEIIRQCDSLIFQVLTKRHARIAANLPADWGAGYPNVWLGVSAEDQEWADRRIPALLAVPAAVRFVSYEPALGPVDFMDYLPEPAGRPSGWCAAHGAHGLYDERGKRVRGCACGDIDWVIVGGESGSDARPFDLTWARSAIAQCKEAGAACFVKQIGAKPIIDGETGDILEVLKLSCGHSIANRVAELHLRDSHGGDPDEWPEDLRVREMPR